MPSPRSPRGEVAGRLSPRTACFFLACGQPAGQPQGVTSARSSRRGCGGHRRGGGRPVGLVNSAAAALRRHRPAARPGGPAADRSRGAHVGQLAWPPAWPRGDPARFSSRPSPLSPPSRRTASAAAACQRSTSGARASARPGTASSRRRHGRAGRQPAGDARPQDQATGRASGCSDATTQRTAAAAGPIPSASQPSAARRASSRRRRNRRTFSSAGPPHRAAAGRTLPSSRPGGPAAAARLVRRPGSRRAGPGRPSASSAGGRRPSVVPSVDRRPGRRTT